MGLSLALTAQRESKGTRFIIQVERGMLGRPLGVVERARWAITVKGLLPTPPRRMVHSMIFDAVLVAALSRINVCPRGQGMQVFTLEHVLIGGLVLPWCCGRWRDHGRWTRKRARENDLLHTR
jgi:hypothetical protein